MRNRSIAFPFAILVAVAIIVFFIPTPGVAGGDAASAGQTVYNSKCASCHGKDGAGQTAQGKKHNLKDLGSAEVQKMTDAQMIELTTKGKNKMPAYEKKLTAEQIKDVVAYVRMFKK